jgi:hypothetical protein
VTSTLPDVEAEGDVTVIVVALMYTTFVADKLPKRTFVVFEVNPVPEIVTEVPPLTTPFVGERLVRVGFP